MAVSESKLKTGVLTLGGTGGTGGSDFACQATNVRIVPEHNEEGDELETLCGDILSPDTKTTWSLQGTSVQDFDNPTGFIKYSWDNNLDDVEFTWEPNTNGASFTGTVNVRALELGGDVNTRLTSDFDWPITGEPAATWPVAPPLDTDTTQQEEPVEEYSSV